MIIFNSGRFTVATESWTAVEYHSHAKSVKDCVEIHVHQRIVDSQKINITMHEFILMVAEAGKVLDLRDLQVTT